MGLLELGSETKTPWGQYITLAQNTPCSIKILTVMPGEQTSLQYHKKRDEFLMVLEGICKIEKDGHDIICQHHDHVYIEREQSHRITGTTYSVLLEISFGNYQEQDIVRLEDKYGRVERY